MWALRLLSLLALAGGIAFASPARANDFAQFQNARSAYDSLNYELAAELFSGLLSSATAEDTRPLVLESRKYLAASYLFLGRNEQGEAQFATLLRAVPDYELDPLAFPAEVLSTFEAVQQRLAEEERQAAAAEAAAEAEKVAAERARLRRQQARLDRLIKLAKTERVEQKRSRMIAMLPFGIGQFQNGHDGLGLVLAVSETVLLGTGVATYFAHEGLPDRPEVQQAADVEEAERLLRWGNNLSMGLLAVVAVTGIIDAQVRFKESTSEDRERDLPPELQGFELGVGIGPGGVSLNGRF